MVLQDSGQNQNPCSIFILMSFSNLANLDMSHSFKRKCATKILCQVNVAAIGNNLIFFMV